MDVLASGMITIVDIYDSKALNAWISASQTTVQTYNNTTLEYSPNYESSPQVLTLNLTEAGGTASVLSTSMTDIKWFKTVGNAKTEITSTVNTATEYKSGTAKSVLTTKSNVPTSTNAVIYTAEGKWTDSSTGHVVNFSAKIDLTLIQLAKAALIGNIYAPNGDFFRNKTPLSLKLNADLYKDGSISAGSKKIKWFAADNSVNVSQDNDAGVGWRKITATSGNTGAVSNVAFDTATTLQGILTVYPDIVLNNQTFMCVITDNEGGTTGMKVKLYYTLRDMDDPILAIIDSTGGNILYNGEGANVLTGRLYQMGNEIDQDGSKYVYKWYKWVNNEMVLDFGGSDVAYKTGKSLTVESHEIDSTTTFKLEVEG